MSTGTGVDASKFIGYAVTAPPKGVDVSKVNAYAVTSPTKAVNVSKIVAYAVITAVASNVARPVVQCCG